MSCLAAAAAVFSCSSFLFLFFVPVFGAVALDGLQLILFVLLDFFLLSD